jgi:hypothetical protein
MVTVTYLPDREKPWQELEIPSFPLASSPSERPRLTASPRAFEISTGSGAEVKGSASEYGGPEIHKECVEEETAKHSDPEMLWSQR